MYHRCIVDQTLADVTFIRNVGSTLVVPKRFGSELFYVEFHCAPTVAIRKHLVKIPAVNTSLLCSLVSDLDPLDCLYL